MKQKKQHRTLVLSRGTIAVKSITVLIVGVAGLGIGLTGCSSGLGSSSTTAVPVLLGKGNIHGSVYGGQQPVIGAKIQLYYVGSSGRGSAATALIPTQDQVVYNGSPGTGALTDSSGNFQITGDYTCPTTSQQVYLVASGGTSQGLGVTASIPPLPLMAPLGDCAILAANATTTSLQINEITTVASVYALAPYMTGYANVGAASVNNTGLINAVGNFNNLVNVTTGTAGGALLPTGATVPVTEINTLANIYRLLRQHPALKFRRLHDAGLGHLGHGYDRHGAGVRQESRLLHADRSLLSRFGHRALPACLFFTAWRLDHRQSNTPAAERSARRMVSPSTA